MRNQLLGIFTEAILPILILLISIIVAIFLYKFLKKKFNKPLDTSIKQNDTPLVKLRQNYCSEEEMKFLEALHKALPRECICFPQVGVSKLIEPKGNLNDYKSIESKFVDICVFLRKDMKPILVIDLYSPSPTAQQLKKFDDKITNVLKVAKIPVMHKQIQKSYNLDDLLVEVLQHFDNTTTSYLKNKMIGVDVNK